MTAQTPSPPPQRIPSGSTTDAAFGPLHNSGMGNPFFYHQFADDFDNQLGATGLYVQSGAGSVVHTPGDGGLALFSTTAAAGTVASIQLPAADFILPTTGANPPFTNTSVKKLFWLCRLQLSDVVNSALIAGLCNITTTPFAAIADGIYFNIAAGSTTLNLLVAASAGNSPTGGAIARTLAIPAAAYALTNNVPIDLAFYVDRKQNVYAYVGAQLVGYIPQSGTGPVNSAGVSVIPSAPGAVAALQQSATSTPLSLANLSPTLALSNGTTAAIKTMTVDFHCAQKER